MPGFGGGANDPGLRDFIRQYLNEAGWNERHYSNGILIDPAVHPTYSLFRENNRRDPLRQQGPRETRLHGGQMMARLAALGIHSHSVVDTGVDDAWVHLREQAELAGRPFNRHLIFSINRRTPTGWDNFQRAFRLDDNGAIIDRGDV